MEKIGHRVLRCRETIRPLEWTAPGYLRRFTWAGHRWARGVLVVRSRIGFGVILMAVAETGRLPGCYDGRNGVLENQLLLVVGFENDAVLIEAPHSARKLHPAGQIDRHGQALFARSI
jgi:hypothetical protein